MRQRRPALSSIVLTPAPLKLKLKHLPTFLISVTLPRNVAHSSSLVPSRLQYRAPSDRYQVILLYTSYPILRTQRSFRATSGFRLPSHLPFSLPAHQSLPLPHDALDLFSLHRSQQSLLRSKTMARSLPSKRNPLIAPGSAPARTSMRAQGSTEGHN